jgi:hypothetical protein
MYTPNLYLSVTNRLLKNQSARITRLVLGVRMVYTLICIRVKQGVSELKCTTIPQRGFTPVANDLSHKRTHTHTHTHKQEMTGTVFIDPPE